MEFRDLNADSVKLIAKGYEQKTTEQKQITTHFFLW